MELALAYKVDMPITREVYRVLYEGISVQECFKALLKIESGSEKEPG
jgi:glycerol-3-phosphate dehydrogenase (NAD(P)+)